MKIVRQLTIFFVVALAGEVVSEVLPIAMPGSVLAMVLMYILLSMGVVKEWSVREVADFLAKNMAIFFIPLAVEVVEIYKMLDGRTWEIIGLCVVTTVLTFLTTVGVALLVMRYCGSGKGDDCVE